MSADATGWTFRHSPYTGVKFTVHLAVADSVNDQHGNELWLAQGRLADKARCSRKAAIDALATLVADGFLELLEDNVGKPNRYRFAFPNVPVVYETRTRSRSQGVTTGDRSVPPDLSPHSTGVSPPFTSPVTTGDTEPKGTQAEPKASPSAPSEPWGSTFDGAGEEEVLLEPLLKALGRIRFELLDRVRHDKARGDLVEALRALRDGGWPESAAMVALTADPLDDARSVARVLTARARHLAELDPPRPVLSPRPVHDCLQCDGAGWVADRGAGADVAPCTCRTEQEIA